VAVIGWIDVATGNVYSKYMMERALVADGRQLKVAKPTVIGRRSYINIHIYKKRQLTRSLLMWRSAMGIPYNIHFPEIMFDIDHIDPGLYMDKRSGKMVLNDDISNLQILSRKDHNIKTIRDNPNLDRPCARKTLYLWKDEQKTELIRTFGSLNDAARHMNKPSGTLHFYLKKEKKVDGGYLTYGNPVDELCEEGKEKYSRHTKKTLVKDYEGNEFYPGCYIYNTGIIQYPNGRMTIGGLVKKDGDKGSRQISLKGRSYTIYGLVNSSFNGHQKNKNDQTAHLRRDGYIKYTEKDLEWQSPAENQTEAHGKRVKVTNKETGETLILDSLEQAAKKFDFPSNTLSSGMLTFGVYTPSRLKHLSHLIFEKL
jgi:hypothetical protein